MATGYVDCENNIQYRVEGSNQHGQRFPLITGFAHGLEGIAQRIKDYKETYKCCHVKIDMAFPYEKT